MSRPDHYQGITRRAFIELTAATGAAALVGGGEGELDESNEPVTVQASAPARVTAFESIDLTAQITGRPRRIAWESESDALLTIDGFDSATATVRAPCVVVDTP